MKTVSKKFVDYLREKYPVGCRVELINMDDSQAPPVGTCGTVYGVDDVGTVHVHWDNGCGLGVVYGVDRCRKIS